MKIKIASRDKKVIEIEVATKIIKAIAQKSKENVKQNLKMKPKLPIWKC